MIDTSRIPPPPPDVRWRDISDLIPPSGAEPVLIRLKGDIPRRKLFILFPESRSLARSLSRDTSDDVCVAVRLMPGSLPLLCQLIGNCEDGARVGVWSDLFTSSPPDNLFLGGNPCPPPRFTA